MIINKGIVQGSIKPPEWDLDSSEVTVYHRTNIKEVQIEYGIMWQYNEEQMSFKDYALYTQKMMTEQGKEVAELKKDKADLAQAILDIQVQTALNKIGG